MRRGLVVKRKFPFSWTKDHFKYYESEYACHAKNLVREEARTLHMPSRWVI